MSITIEKIEQIAKQLNVDPWDVCGNEIYHKFDLYTSFENKLLNILPENKYPINVGKTGYIFTTDKINESYGRCVDSFGRNIFVLGNTILFQRYIFGNTYVEIPLTNGQITGDVKNINKNSFELFVSQVEEKFCLSV